MATRPRRILVPTDFSETSHEAVRYGLLLARAFDAQLHIMHVIPDPIDLGWAVDTAHLPQLFERTETAAREQLERQLTDDERAQTRPHFTIVTGAPAARILEFAENEQIDLIVMGTRGRGALQSVWLGSVTGAVLARAACPVLSVQQRSRG